MARIPVGDFGNVVARPGPHVNVDPDAYGAGVGRALDQAGKIGMNIAGQEIDAANADAKRVQREQAAEAKAAATEARRVKALTAQATISNGLNELHDEVEKGLADGSVDKAKAAEVYATKSQKIVDQGVEGVDENHRDLVRATVLNDQGRGRQAVSKLVTQRDKADIKAGGLSYIEEMQRFASRGAAEADQAIANVKTFWTATGPMAGEDPAQAQARVQQFAEKVRYQQASSLVNTDPGAALKALKDSKYLPELDPGQRTSLLHTADTRVLQAAQRAEIRAAANERKMTREWTAVSTVLEAGKALDPAYAADVMKKFKGTSYEGALGQLMAEGPANAAFAARPLAMQQRTLDEMQGAMNREGATPEKIKAYQRADKAFKAAQADIKGDPYAAAAERGVIKDIAPLSLDINTLPQQLAKRAFDAEAVSQWVGKDVSLFRPAEADRVGEVIKALPPKERSVALSGLSKVMTPGQTKAFAEQLNAKDRGLYLALAVGDSSTTSGRYTSELLLKGQAAMADGTSTKNEKQASTKPNQWRRVVATEVEGVFPSQELTNDVTDAAVLIAHGIAAEQGGKLDDDDLKRAVRLAAGSGELVEHNGRKVLLPAGMDADTLTKNLRRVTPDQIKQQSGADTVRASGVPMPVADFVKTLPGAELSYAGPGRFNVLVGGRPVTSADGKRRITIGVQ